MKTPLIAASALAEALEGANPPRVLDCRARLGEPDAGRQLWSDAHLPGSDHLDLDRDLAGPPGESGRHPLPTHAVFTRVVQRLGIAPGQPVVVYDDRGGQLAAARAWWMLACWAGHPDVRVLDGGIEAWLAAGGQLLEDGAPEAMPAGSDWQPTYHDESHVSAEELLAGSATLIDARARERFRGEVEPIDPVAGHIPGAVCRPSADNLTGDGHFKSTGALASELPEGESPIAYCGSGVTACHNILAYAVACRPLPRLFAGSWSEWIRDPDRPIATGD
ncbi:MAG: sulfurtransferase [Pseudomonadota bacterium]